MPENMPIADNIKILEKKKEKPKLKIVILHFETID